MQRIKSFILENLFLLSIAAAFFIVAFMAFLPGSGPIFAGIFSVMSLIAVVVLIVYKLRNILPSKAEAGLNSLTADLLMKLGLPVLLVASDGSIIWYNKAFSGISEHSGAKYGHDVGSFFGGALMTSKNKNETVHIEVGEKAYSVQHIEVNSSEGEMSLFVWIDESEIRDLKDLMQKKTLIVGYAAIDNATEVTPFLQEKFRKMVAKAYTELYNWVSDMNGILREYDRDKYIILLDYENFLPNIGKKFDILDKINNAVSGENARITISMSFANVTGNLNDRDNAAKDALDYAFQRGGAQVIVKNDEGSLSFGGKSRAVEKTTKIKSRVTADRLMYLISQSSNVIVMGHKNIDLDAMASCCAVARLAMEMNKKVNIIVNDKDLTVQQTYSLFEGLEEYNDIFVDCSIGQEMLLPESLVVVVDANNEKIFESFDIYANAQTVAIIDHHVQTSEFSFNPALQYIDPTASSASELMCEVLEQAIQRKSLKNQEAELLFAGILLDTQKLTRNTGVRTFGAAMYLRPDATMMNDAQSFFKPALSEYTKQAVFQKNTSIVKGVYAVSYYDEDNLPENRIMASIAAEKMLNISSVRASFAIALIAEDIHISGRSDGSINVAKILEQLGGGGRFEAAATVLQGATVKSAKKSLFDAIEQYTNETITGGI